MLPTIQLGNKENPPLVFLHGFMGSKEDFLELAGYFSSDYHCILLDLPGHGESNSFAPHSKPFIWAKDLIQETVKDLDDPTFIAYSLGGRLLLHLDAPKRVFISSHLGLKTLEEKRLRKGQDASQISRLQDNFEGFLNNWYNQDLFVGLEKTSLIERRERNNPEHLAKAMEAFSLSKQKLFEPQEGDFFLCGEKDKKYHSLYQKRACPFAVIPSASHAPHLENPKLVFETINTHLKERS